MLLRAAQYSTKHAYHTVATPSINGAYFARCCENLVSKWWKSSMRVRKGAAWSARSTSIGMRMTLGASEDEVGLVIGAAWMMRLGNT